MSAPSSQSKYVLKIGFVGDGKVGKSTLISRFTEDKFLEDYRATIGLEFRVKDMNIDGRSIIIQTWDTGGQERFRSISPAYYRGIGGAMLVYDVTSHSSYINVVRWLKRLRDNMSTEAPILLVGNKSDLYQLREVTTEEAKSFAAEEGLHFIEISAFNGSNVENAFREVSSDALHLASEQYYQAPYLIEPRRGKAINIAAPLGGSVIGSRRCY